MYGLSPDVDLSFLVGQQIQSVRVSWTEVILDLDHDTRIWTATTLHWQEPGQKPLALDEARSAGKYAIDLIGDLVQAAFAEEGGTLALHFASGKVLRIVDEDVHYECYTITSPGGIIVV